MTSSAPPWTIAASAERIELNPQGKAETTFTVTNNGPIDQRLVVDTVRSDNAAQVKIVVDEPQRLVTHGGTAQFLARVTVPAGTAAAVCWFAGRVYSADAAPEESSVLSDRVAFEIKPTAPPRKPPIWLWLVPAIVLALIVTGVVLFLLLRDGADGPPVHRAGTLVVDDDRPFDLDELERVEFDAGGLTEGAEVMLSGAAEDADRFFGRADLASCAVTGRCATLALINPTSDPMQACQRALQQAPITQVAWLNFASGDIFCVRTDQGRLSVAEVTDKVSAVDSTVTLKVTTYEIT
jgi:hypothetical protein